ncbi:MAG: hypothetical protein ABSE73_23755, partial [Planctomycetota bacterium]
TPASGTGSTKAAESAAAEPDPKAVAKSLAAILRKDFRKLTDGTWSYPASMLHCDSAEGLAAELKLPPDEAPQGLGDCLLCANWNKHLGCALACSYELEARNRYQGLQLATEQAMVWAGAGRLDMAIALLEDYVKNHPNDPAGFRELARMYDRPDYRERDKRRAIVLYLRFAEMARQGSAFTKLEISLAEERAAALRTANLEQKNPVVPHGTGLIFQCFYRGHATSFAYGVLTKDRLVVARVGDVDPETGLLAIRMSGKKARASAIFQSLRTESSKKDKLAQAGQELARLSGLELDELASDSACLCNLPCNEMTGATLEKAQPPGASCITIVAGSTHQLVFPAAAAFKADQCYELLHRRLGRPVPK